MLFWKLLDHRYVQSSFSTFTRHIDNSISKTPYSWRCYVHGSTYVPMLSWVNIIKWKPTKVPKISVTQKSKAALRGNLRKRSE